MTSYPDTTLPPSLPYGSLDDIMTVLTDRCLIIAEDTQYSKLEQEQYFHFTMELVDFWMKEEDHGEL